MVQTAKQRAGLAKAQNTVARNAGLSSFPAKGTPEARQLMAYVRSQRNAPATQAEAQAAFNRFYAPRGRYGRLHKGKSAARAKAQDKVRSMGPRRVISTRKYLGRPDLYDFQGVDAGRIAPRALPAGFAPKMGRSAALARARAARKARAAARRR